MWLRDTGILDKVKNDVANPPIPIPDPTVRQNQPLILRQLGIILIILIVGLVIGIIAFFLELFFRPKARQSPDPTDEIELKETIERHNNIIWLTASS